MITTILLLVMAVGLEQELPEPLMPTYTYEKYQILWGTIVGTPIWVDIVPKSVEVKDGLPPSQHSYKGRIGDNYWHSVAMDSTVEKPRIIEVVIDIPSIPNNGIFGFYRIRNKASTIIAGVSYETEWSPPSYWVWVLDLGSLARQIGSNQ